MLTPNAQKIFELRYSRKDENGKPTESAKETFHRVARAVAEAPVTQYDPKGGILRREMLPREEVEALFYQYAAMLENLDFLPNSPTFTGAGTELGQLAACFVLGLSDDMGGNEDGIFSTLRKAALIQQTGGGNGFPFSNLRPKGALVKRSMGKASGPVSFLRVYDKAFGEVYQGGVRRGANMGVMRVDHPDIEEFISAKSKEGDITNFNISVALTDEFMSAVLTNKSFDLRFDGKVYKTVNARELFRKICENAWRNGEPGALFIDTANKSNPVPHLYTLEATNPCAEQWLGPNENCCLGSINLANHVEPNGDIDWEKLGNTVHTATRFLDMVIDANKYVPAVSELEEAALTSRRIGLGIMGLADLLAKRGLSYASDRGRKLASSIMEYIRYMSMNTSIELARAYGSFGGFEGSIYSKPSQLEYMMRIYQDRTVGVAFGRPLFSWASIRKGINSYGIRNAAQTTIAPTGTISSVAGCEGYGCEPIFALGYVRHVKESDGDVDLEYVSPLFEDRVNQMKQIGTVTPYEADLLLKEAKRTGSIQYLVTSQFSFPNSIAELQSTFMVAEDISAANHLAMQAALQKWVDNSISKTINAPNSMTVEEVEKLYMDAWLKNCKGITIYRTGSRESVVLETKATIEAKQREVEGEETPVEIVATTEPAPLLIENPLINNRGKRMRAELLNGTTVRQETPLGTAYVNVNYDEHEQPFEVFVTIGKAGTDASAIAEGMGRLMSMILRTPGQQNGHERLQWIAEELSGIGTSNTMGFGKNRIMSFPDGIAQAIRKATFPRLNKPVAEAGEPVHATVAKPSDICSQCNMATVIISGGCPTCTACGWSKC